MTSFLGLQDQTWFGSLRKNGGSSGLFFCALLAGGLPMPLGGVLVMGTVPSTGLCCPFVALSHHIVGLGGVHIVSLEDVLSPVVAMRGSRDRAVAC
jgi:hypothetical protein